MVDLKNIIKSAESANKEFHDGYPPVEKWNPEHCGEIGLEIKSDGTWYYMDSPIGRSLDRGPPIPGNIKIRRKTLKIGPKIGPISTLGPHC